jgi:uncharacterized protein (TIGR02996 family)
MNHRDAFLKALAENENDTTTRLVFADWLDEQGEHEEADRQRKWPAAKEWLVRLCNEDASYRPFSYEELIEFGRRVVKEESISDRVYPDNSGRVFFDNWDLWSVLRANSQEFWKNWSVVTGIALPPSLEDKDFHHWECCAHKHYYWFGRPDSTDADE